MGVTAVFTVSGDTTPDLQFRYSVREGIEEFRIRREFSLWRAFEWTPLDEGAFDVKLSVRRISTGEVTESTIPYEATSRVTTQPLVSLSAHPLVALYSAPGCGSGSLRVRYRLSTGGAWQYTPWKSCSSRSINLWVAGMLAQSTYVMQQEVLTDGVTRGPVIAVTTGTAPASLPRVSVPVPPTVRASFADGIVLHSVQAIWPFIHPAPVATDLNGRVVWY